jgi:hypothetical protein
MKRDRNRLLVTLALTAAFATVVVGDALASRWIPSVGSPITTASSPSIAKPTARPTNGEPDGGQTIAPPVSTSRSLSPMDGWARHGFDTHSHSDWIQLVWAYWFTRASR